ncbi:MAG: hypothetical protein RLO50_11505 [Azospirillaceae bacterium]
MPRHTARLSLAMIVGVALMQAATAQEASPLGPSSRAGDSALRVGLHAPPDAGIDLVLRIAGLPPCTIAGRVPADAETSWVAGLAHVSAVCAFSAAEAGGLDRAGTSQVRGSGSVTVDGRTHLLEGGGGHPFADVYDADLRISPKGEVAFIAAVG